jgi:DNA-binding beta-propeller fold protein YncE
MRYMWIIALSLAASSVQAQSGCPARLLVSGYFSNNVHVYDACTGAFERLLDNNQRIAGAQATGVGPDGKLYVVSEGSGQVLRYNAQSLEFEAVAITLPPSFGATGMVFAPGNEIWVAGYTYDGVMRFSMAGVALGDAVAPRAGGLNGADNGMTIGPDGRLYVPGYDSDSVVRRDPASGQTSTFIAARAGGLNETRGILFEPGGQTVLVSSEGSGKVLRFNAASGTFLSTVISGLNRPTGMAYHPDGSLLVVQSSSVEKYDPQTYAARGTLATAGAGQASGLTYVTVLPVASQSLDLSQVGSQYWISGSGPITQRTIAIDQIISTVGPAFGAAYDPAELVIKRWGSMRVEFTSCNTAMFSWDSTGMDSAGFGAGGYPLQRIVDSEQTQACQQQGFANANDLQWINGTWYGGAARNGEGIMIDKTLDGRAFVAWFTYRPRE